MNRSRNKRLRKVTQQIDAMPLAPAVEDAAFDKFRETGELPEHQRVAASAVDRALRGGTIRRQINPGDEDAKMRRVSDLVQEMLESRSKPPPNPIRKQLFNEAVYGPAVIRVAAREALEVLVAVGVDITDPQFLGENMQVPDYGSVGLHLLGFPECLVKPPYEEQAQRLLNRFASLRERVNRDDKDWFSDAEAAETLFLSTGELPDDELMRETVLASREFTALLGYYCGDGDVEVLAAFDQVARATGPDRDAAIECVQVMAVEGRMLSPNVSE